MRLFGAAIGLAVILGFIWFGSSRGAATAETATQAATAPEMTIPPATQAVPIRQNIPYTGIFAVRLVSYDGPYLENYEGEELVGVAALELRNVGDKVVEYVQAVVSQPDRQLCFEATYIPPGGSVLVLEKDAKPYDTDLITGFQCPAVVCMEQPAYSEKVQVEEDGYCAMKVTNLTEETLSCVRVFYKQYYEADGLYLGGVTYSLVLPDLQPGASITRSPYHFAAEYSRIVAVTVEP